VRRILRSAWGDRIGVERRRLAPGPELTRYPSSIAEIDGDPNARGFYGLTVVAGETGVGKSTIGLGAAIEAALLPEAERWKVAYFEAELDDATVFQMVQRKTGKTQDWLAENLYPAFDYFTVGFGASAEQIVRNCIVSATRAKLLVVLDSINTIANKALGEERGSGYFQFMRDLTGWALEARRDSLGDIAFLVLSETNKDGATKGRGADYWADFVLNVRLATQERDAVKLRVLKGRYSGRRDLGLYVLDWRSGRLLTEQALADVPAPAPAYEEDPF
jgi:predicted ATP-dependent serine protease